MKSIAVSFSAVLVAGSFALTGCAISDKSGDPGTDPGEADVGVGDEGTDDTDASDTTGGPGTDDTSGTVGDDTGAPVGPGDSDDADTGAGGPGGPSGSGTDGEPGGDTDNAGDTSAGSGGPGTDDEDTGSAGTGGPGDGPAGPGGGEDTAVAAIAFYVNGLVEGSGAAQTFTGAYGVIAYGVDSLYVNFDDQLCSWYATNSSAGTPSDCTSCEYSFDIHFDTPIEDGASCDALDDGLGPYGYTGAEVFEVETSIGFEKVGSSSYGSFDYDYGYLAVYTGYPYYSWYDSTTFSTYSYPDYYDASITVLYAIDGYYGVIWRP